MARRLAAEITDGRLARQEQLGFEVHPGSIDEYLALTRRHVVHRAPLTVLYHNLHSLYLYCRLPALRRHYRGGTILIDGMPIIWLLRLLGRPVSRRQRITYVDFIIPLLTLARDNDWMVWHVGQSERTQSIALENLRTRLPGLRINGHHGYFDKAYDSEESRQCVADMNAADADLVLIGFGTPIQERWISEHREQIIAPAVFACGACMEYLAGEVRTPPRWMGRAGLEWAYRLGENPRRFAFRYLVEPMLLGLLLLRQGLSSYLNKRQARR